MRTNLFIIFSLYYFILATIGGFFATILPLYYIELGFSTVEISVLSSLLFVATFIQLFLNKYIKDIKFWFILSSIIILISILLLKYSEEFIVISAILFLSTGFRIIIVSLIDDYTLTTNLDIGKTRKFATIGFGCSGIIYLFISKIFSPFTMIFFFTILLLVITLFLPKYQRHNNDTSFKNVTHKNMIIFNAVFMAIVGLKLTYQSIYFSDATLVAIFMFFTVIIEAVILNYSSRIVIKRKVFISVVLFCISIFVLLISTSYVAIVISAAIQGISLGIYVPSYFIFLKDNSKNLTSTIIYSSTMQCIVGFLIAFIFVLPIYSYFNVSVVLFSFTVLLMIWYFIYKYINKRQKS